MLRWDLFQLAVVFRVLFHHPRYLLDHFKVCGLGILYLLFPTSFLVTILLCHGNLLGEGPLGPTRIDLFLLLFRQRHSELQ